MAEDRFLAKYERLWSRSSLTVFSGLCCVKSTREDWEVTLPRLFTLGAEYNVVLAALFARNIMPDNAWYKKIVLEAVKAKIPELPNRDADIKAHLKEAGTLWKALILIWDETNREQVSELLAKLYHGYVGDKEAQSARKITNCDYRISSEVLEPPIDMTADVNVANSINAVYPANDVYICSMYMFRQLIEKENLAEIEVYNRNFVYFNQINSFTKVLLKDYVEELFEEKNYKALSSFMHKTIHVDYEDVFGMSREMFWDKMIGSQSPRLADCYLRMSLRSDTEYLGEWKRKIYGLVQSKDCLAWCDWAYYWFCLDNLLEKEDLTEAEFQEEARKELPTCDFPFETADTFNRITGAVTYIFSEFWERGWNPFFLLDLWGENNLFSYNRRNVYRKSPLGFQNSAKIHNWKAHEKAFWEYECSEEERIRIYMNSPIRCVIDFHATMIEFIERMGMDDNGQSKFANLFHEYLLEGCLRNIDAMNAAGYLRFEISNHFYSEYRWKNWSVKDKRFYNALLFNSEAWYRNNEFLAKRIKLDVPCSFRLCGCYMTGYSDAVLYVDDISTPYLSEIGELYEAQGNEMREALEWMRRIREEKRIIPVDKKSFRNLTYPNQVKMQQEFAEAIFDTVYELRENPVEAFRFLGTIHTGRLDKISAYQYLLNREILFKFKVEGGLGSVWRRFNALCRDSHFTVQQKVNIYMNTYLRSFCSLAELWDKLNLQEEDMINLAARNSEYDRFLFLVDFKRNENGTAVFSLNKDMKLSIGGKDENYRWCLAGKELPAKQIHSSFRVSIRDIDTEAKIIWIGQFHPKKIRDRWGLTVRRLNDLKDNPSRTHIKKVRDDVALWGMDFREKNRLEQLVIQFVGHFSLIEKEEYPQEYNLFWCRSILDVFGDKNPFVEPLTAPLQIEAKELERMRDGIPSFMQAAYKRSDIKGEAFCRDMIAFYECSPYRLICEHEAFETLLEQVISSSI